jgi:group II intron reverse transcriptase/maturase
MNNKHVEGRGCHAIALYQGNIRPNTGGHTGGVETMTTGLERISQLAKEHPDRKMQTLMHLVNTETLRGIHDRQDKDKAYGVDRVTKAEYEENIEENLDNLIARMKQFSYRPQPVRRAYIPKDGSDQLRPLGVPAYEDKLVQGAMADILTAIYEQRFYDFSYGFRPGRSQHQAIGALDKILWGWTNWVVDADIKAFFDSVDHEWLMKFLEHDIGDKNFLRYVTRFLKAGVMEDGRRYDSEAGVPQGSLIGPVMSNVYLHYVIDMWFAEAVIAGCKGRAEMIRYADDTVFCFEMEEDARRFFVSLRKRVEKFNLVLSEEKSKIIRFGRNSGDDSGKFDFLGFTHVSARNRNGTFFVKRSTSQKKLKAKRQMVKKWLRENMHTPIKVLIDKLNVKLRGHYNYYGIIGNSDAMGSFREYVLEQLLATLNRRGSSRDITYEKFQRILKRFPVITPRIVHRV